MIRDDYKLVWSEEFDGSEIDRNTWRFEEGYVRNNELQCYCDSPENAYIEDSCLVIKSIKTGDEECPYTSASLNTHGKKEFLYGKLEMRAKLPCGEGIWPAFWTLGVNIKDTPWPACGEIDIMEMVGGKGRDISTCPFGDYVSDSTVQATVHYTDEKKGLQRAFEFSDRKFCEDFHIFGIEWTEEHIKFYVDNVIYNSVDIRDIEAFHKPQYVLVNTAIGGSWAKDPDDTTEFPQKYYIDWIRYYK